MHRFCSYILRFVVPVIRDRVMSGNAELAAFPQFRNVLYTHNVSESGNAMLKNLTGFKEGDVDSFILDLKELVTKEEEDVARALIGLDSLYEVLEEFRPLVSKNADHLSQADEFQPLGINDTQPQQDDKYLKATEMDQLDALVGLEFSEPMINVIKQKAQNLTAGGLVTRVFNRDQSHFVKSNFSNKAHLVQP